MYTIKTLMYGPNPKKDKYVNELFNNNDCITDALEHKEFFDVPYHGGLVAGDPHNVHLGIEIGCDDGGSIVVDLMNAMKNKETIHKEYERKRNSWLSVIDNMLKEAKEAKEMDELEKLAIQLVANYVRYAEPTFYSAESSS